MADETISDYGNKVCLSPGTVAGQVEVTVGDGDEKPGLIVTAVGETWPEVDLAAAGEAVLGILLELDDEPIDDVITATRGAKGVKALLKGTGHKVRGFYQANGATKTAGTLLIVGSEAGKLAPAAGTEWDDVIVGMLAQNVTQNATDDQVVELII